MSHDALQPAPLAAAAADGTAVTSTERAEQRKGEQRGLMKGQKRSTKWNRNGESRTESFVCRAPYNIKKVTK